MKPDIKNRDAAKTEIPGTMPSIPVNLESTFISGSASLKVNSHLRIEVNIPAGAKVTRVDGVMLKTGGGSKIFV